MTTSHSSTPIGMGSTRAGGNAIRGYAHQAARVERVVGVVLWICLALALFAGRL